VGLHAGWVFVIQLSRKLTDSDPAATFGFVAGRYDGVIGLLAAAWIGALAFGFWGVSGLGKPRRAGSRPPPSALGPRP
jgi:hypothetical protein